MEPSAIMASLSALAATACFAQAASPDPLSGGAGWVGAGLLGCVLAWLLFVHLPGKDKLMKDLLAVHIADRNEERKLRQQVADNLAKAWKESTADHTKTITEILALQTSQLEKMMMTICKSQPDQYRHTLPTREVQ